MTHSDAPEADGLVERSARRSRHEAILAQVAEEEGEVAEQAAAALSVALHLRVARDLDEALRRRATTEHISTSAPARRLLRHGLLQTTSGLSQEDELIARRVTREALRAP